MFRDLRPLLGCLALWLLAILPALGEDWPGWRGPLRTGAVANSPPLIDELPTEGLLPQWVSEPVMAARNGGWASPVIADGKVFLFAHEREQLQELGKPKYPYLPDDKRGGMSATDLAEYEKNRRTEEQERSEACAFREHVFAFDAETGETVWHNRSDSVYSRWPQSGSPTVAGGRLWLLGAGLNFRCLDANTGEDLWTQRLPGEFTDEFFQSSVVLVDNLAIVMATKLFALNADTGAIVWAGERTAFSGLHSTPAVWQSPSGMRVLVNIGGGQTGCFDCADGRLVWLARTEGGHSTPIVVGDRLITYGNSRQKGLRCSHLRETGAEELWQFHGAQDKGSTPVVVGDYVYVQGDRRVACVGLTDGKAAWTGELDLASPQYTSLVAADNKVFFAYDGLTVFRATPDAFEPLFQAKFNASQLMATEPQLRAMLKIEEIEQQPNGQVLAMRTWQREVNQHGPLKCGTPAMANGRMYLRTNKAVVCYDLRKPVAIAP
ncbi:MAG: PQQ-binding-like beta-propeller repeat protein [Planctomycetaceae bacterium]